MRVLGIDPGTGIVGFGVVEFVGNQGKMIDAGVVRTRPHQPLDERLVEIYQSIEQIIKQNKPEVMIIEKLFFAQNVTTAISVSHARGVIMLAGKQKDLKIVEITPLQIKHSLTGYGRATKHQIQEMVKTMLNLSEVPKPDDCADALAAALCYTDVINRW
jgi:crossover junction endodeoxyribonuclease RuvC